MKIGREMRERGPDLCDRSGMIVAPRAGLEPAAYCLGGSCSIRLSYRGLACRGSQRTGGQAKPSLWPGWPQPGFIPNKLPGTAVPRLQPLLSGEH